MAKAHELGFTIDAEEADRLELSLEVIGAVLGNPALRGFEGFGLAVQAYQKRALAVIDWTEEAAAASAAGSRSAWSRAPIGTPRSSARRSAACPTIRCSRARP